MFIQLPCRTTLSYVYTTTLQDNSLLCLYNYLTRPSSDICLTTLQDLSLLYLYNYLAGPLSHVYTTTLQDLPLIFV